VYYGDLTIALVRWFTPSTPDRLTPRHWGGIWQGGAAWRLVKSKSGNPYYIYFSTADGAFDNPQNQFGNAGDSALKANHTIWQL